ncbi:MAG: helix-turn-helix domain-containing protein [Alteromonadaceae bacterium]|nr:helix-turn-helix domain-containing protein [Alteromonadaceae bacterium]
MVYVSLDIETMGSQKALANALNVSTMAVSKWVSVGKIPTDRVLGIEELSGVPCHVIRPDIYPPVRFKKAI